MFWAERPVSQQQTPGTMQPMLFWGQMKKNSSSQGILDFSVFYLEKKKDSSQNSTYKSLRGWVTTIKHIKRVKALQLVEKTNVSHTTMKVPTKVYLG